MFSSAEYSKSYFCITHGYKLNLIASGIAITFISLSDLNKSVCFESIFQTLCILSPVYFNCSHFMKVPNLVHGIQVHVS